MTHKIIVPLFVETSRKERVYLNLNTYRNLHYTKNNRAKKKLESMLFEQLQGLKIQTPVVVTYQVFKPSKRRLDKMNVVSIVSKFALDAVTNYGCWTDDSDEFVKQETILPTVYDKNNGRCEILITEI